MLALLHRKYNPALIGGTFSCFFHLLLLLLMRVQYLYSHKEPAPWTVSYRPTYMYTQHPKLYNVHTEDHFDSIFILSLSHLSVLWSIDIQYKKGGLLVVALLFSNRFHRVTIIYSVEYDPPLGYTSFVCVPIFLVEKNKKIKNGSNQRLFVGLLWFYSSTIFWVISNCCWPVYCRRHPKRFFTDGGTGQRTFCVDRFLAVATGCLLMFPNIQWWIEL